MKLSTLLLCCSALAPALSRAGEPLITLAESQAEQAVLSRSILIAKGVPPAGAPTIDLVEPADPQNIATTPFPVRVHFNTEGGAALVPASLQVYYGAFGINITDRLLKRATFVQNELRIDQAEVPSGKHRLLLKIQDSNNRSNEKLLTLVVK